MVCSVEMVLGFAVVDEERVVCFVPLVHVPFTGSHVSLTHWLQLSRQPSPYVPNEHSGKKRNKNHFLELAKAVILSTLQMVTFYGATAGASSAYK